MRTLPVLLTLLGSTTMLGCGGGDDPPGVPLVSASITGEFEGRSFTPAFGFVALYQERHVIGLGDGPLHCGSPDQPDPPSGTNAAFALPALEVGTYGSILVQLYENIDEFSGVGSNSGTVELTAVTATTVTGEIHYQYTSDAQLTYRLNGTFEVTRCPE